MFYKEILEKLLKEEKNPVNKMYLHEINIKWQNFLKSIEESNGANKDIVDKLNVFRKSIIKNKYKFNKSNSRGFSDDSLVYSVNYLHDLISVIMRRKSIVDHTGIFWGSGKFNMNYSFQPQSFNSLENNLKFKQSISPTILLLGQKIDIRFRISGKRNFENHKSMLPLIIFQSFKVFKEEQMLYSNYLAQMAKNSFSKARMIILTEKLEKDFIPDLESTSIDHVCELINDNDNNIAPDKVDELDKLINDIIFEKYTISQEAIKNNLIISRRKYK
ncbi:MAG: hypothetical protein K9N07_05860 [Candidatus Cloacimonetes bacterium]|nr:hypothetical protein [Candidatus Cloacimonadota bacterium]